MFRFPNRFKLYRVVCGSQSDTVAVGRPIPKVLLGGIGFKTGISDVCCCLPQLFLNISSSQAFSAFLFIVGNCLFKRHQCIF